MKEEGLKFDGQVLEILPNATFRVALDNNHVIIAYLAGKLRQHNIGVLIGDKVTVAMSPYDLSRGRIVYRN